jgi:hypothetical protein
MAVPVTKEESNKLSKSENEANDLLNGCLTKKKTTDTTRN